MSQTPDIKPELNKAQGQEPEEKKRGGFFANLGSRLTGSGGLGGAAAGGGLLATKAGIIGLAIIGTTVAGGIGYVGYKAMTPSSEPQALSIFEARPKSALPADGAEGQKGSKDGVSGSLDMFVNANAPAEEKTAEAAPAAEPAAKTAEGSSLAPVDHGDASLSGKSASIPKPQFSGKIGQLSGSSGGSGTSAGFSAGSAGGAQFGAGKKGSISAMGRNASARPASVGAALKSLRRGSTMRTLGAVKRDQIGARSSAGAGRTYDGAGQTGSFGADAGVPEGGAGAGAQGAGDLSGNPSTAMNEKEEKPIPKVPPKDVTPWAKELNMAKMLIMGASAILFMAAMLEKTAKFTAYKTVVIVLAAIGALMALAAMVIGFKIAGAQYGQKALGSIIGISGGALLVSAIALMAMDTPADGNTALAAGGDWGTVLVISGAIGIIGAISTNFLKPVTIKCDEKHKNFKDCKAMNLHVPGGAPSDRALERFLV